MHGQRIRPMRAQQDSTQHGEKGKLQHYDMGPELYQHAAATVTTTVAAMLPVACSLPFSLLLLSPLPRAYLMCGSFFSIVSNTASKYTFWPSGVKCTPSS